MEEAPYGLYGMENWQKLRAKIVRMFRKPVCLDYEWDNYQWLAEGDWYTSVTGDCYEIRNGYWQLKRE